MPVLRPHLFLTLTKTQFFLILPRTSSQIRNSSFYSSDFLIDVKPTTKYQITKDPEEWKYVERVLPPILVPQPKKLEVYQSGWKPPGDDFKDSPYFVERSRNHMMPVYLHIMQRGVKRHTILKKIEGDIWQLEKDLRPFLEDIIKPRPLRLQVNEFARKITINGDHVNAIKYWLAQKNF